MGNPWSIGVSSPKGSRVLVLQTYPDDDINFFFNVIDTNLSVCQYKDRLVLILVSKKSLYFRSEWWATKNIYETFLFCLFCFLFHWKPIAITAQQYIVVYMCVAHTLLGMFFGFICRFFADLALCSHAITLPGKLTLSPCTLPPGFCFGQKPKSGTRVCSI